MVVLSLARSVVAPMARKLAPRTPGSVVASEISTPSTYVRALPVAALRVWVTRIHWPVLTGVEAEMGLTPVWMRARPSVSRLPQKMSSVPLACSPPVTPGACQVEPAPTCSVRIKKLRLEVPPRIGLSSVFTSLTSPTSIRPPVLLKVGKSGSGPGAATAKCMYPPPAGLGFVLPKVGSRSPARVPSYVAPALPLLATVGPAASLKLYTMTGLRTGARVLVLADAGADAPAWLKAITW